MDEIRPLQVEDVFAVARMLGKVTKGARMQLASAITGKRTNPTELGMVLFQSLVTDAEEDLKAWLASLALMQIERLSKGRDQEGEPVFNLGLAAVK